MSRVTTHLSNLLALKMNVAEMIKLELYEKRRLVVFCSLFSVEWYLNSFEAFLN